MVLSFIRRSPAMNVVGEVVEPLRGGLMVALALMLLQSGVALAAPWLAGRFSQAVLQHQSVTGWLWGLLAVVVVQSLLTYGVGVRLQVAAARLVEGLSMRVYSHLQVLPLAWHRERSRGAVLSLLTEDVYRIGRFVTGTAVPLVPLLLTCVGAAAMMLRIEPGLAVGVLLVVPAAFVGLRWAGRRLRPLAQQLIDAYATTTGLAEQGLGMLPVTKAFVAESLEMHRYGESIGHLRALEERQIRFQDAIGPVVRILVAIAVLGMLWIGARKVSAGTLTASELVTLLMYGLLLTQPVSQLAAVYGQLQTARGTVHRLDSLFADAPEPDSGRQLLEAPSGEIRFEGVRFGYPDRGGVLRGVDLHVRAGETVAITGVNGAGKSTLIHLLMRFADPDAGRITLDGVDLRELQLSHLRGLFGLVSQQVLLLNGTIRENIAYGSPSASDAEVKAASRLSRADEFISRLPEGYGTRVGDEGLRLSGGQRQRVALARALLKAPPVLVFDEATAMFDSDAETAFVKDARDQLGSKTILLITHRPASLALADRVLVLADGRFRPV